jgi:hypothetical protein
MPIRLAFFCPCCGADGFRSCAHAPDVPAAIGKAVVTPTRCPVWALRHVDDGREIACFCANVEKADGSGDNTEALGVLEDGERDVGGLGGKEEDGDASEGLAFDFSICRNLASIIAILDFVLPLTDQHTLFRNRARKEPCA